MTSAPAALNSQAVTGSDQIIHRVVSDASRQVIFGYDLWIDADPKTKKFSVAVLPADKAFRSKFLKDSAIQREDVFATFQNSTSPQLLADGDAVSLELLVNRQLGVKIVDVVKLSFDRSKLRERSFDPIKDFTPDAVALSVRNYQLLIDGKLIGSSNSTTGTAGSLLWFYVPGRGRFIVSLVPRDGYSFEKIGVLDENRIEFSAGGEHYEWLSGAPILAGGGAWNVWVLQDKNYTPIFGGNDRMQSRSPGVFDKLKNSVSLADGRATVMLNGIPPPTDHQPSPIRQRVMIGAADRIENLLPKSP
jgi:hypothetical protein